MCLHFSKMTAPRTAKGRATRERIVAAAAELIRERGVAETSLDDVLERARASKSQLYLYFPDRAALLREVILHNTDLVLAAEEHQRGSLESWKAIRAWLDGLVELQLAARARGGCPIGSLAGQLAEADEQAREVLADSFARWQERLATATLAAIQGGLLLSQTRRDPGQLAIALDAAYEHLRARATVSKP